MCYFDQTVATEEDPPGLLLLLLVLNIGLVYKNPKAFVSLASNESRWKQLG